VASAVRELPEVSYTMATVAGDGANTRNSASILVKLLPLDARERDVFAVVSDVRANILPRYAPSGVRTSVAATGGIGGGRGGGGGGDVQLVMQGPDLRTLQARSQDLVSAARQIPGLVDVDTNLNTGKPELAVRIDRPKASDLGVQVSDTAEALRLLVGGDQVTTFNENGEQYEVHVRADVRDRTSQEAIAQLPVPSSRLGSITLNNIASFVPDSAPTEIRRLNRQRPSTASASRAVHGS
jgi:HAE1 family hydrophobic/amphiphilic exporter-1